MPESTRQCVICGKTLRRTKRGGIESTFGFSLKALQLLGVKDYHTGKAHPTCVRELQQQEKMK